MTTISDASSGIFNIDKPKNALCKSAATSVSEAEADAAEFKSLKGIAGIPLDSDEVRMERLARHM